VVIVVLVATVGAGMTGGAGGSGTLNDGSNDAAAIGAVDTVVGNETENTDATDNRSEEAGANATIPPHRRPSNVEDDGDPTLLRSRFNGELAGSLIESVEALRERDYDEAEAAIGPEYDQLLRQYEASGGDAATLFNETRLSQEEAIEIAREYQAVRDEYTSALADDDEAAAREAARELQAVAEEATIVAENASANYEALDNVTDEDLGEIAQAVEEVSDQVSADASRIRDSELEPTELTIDADSETASFVDPVRLNGTLRTADGEPVSNRSISLRFAATQSAGSTETTGSENNTQPPVDNSSINRTDTQATKTESSREPFESSPVQTTTDADGNFTVTYRPVQYPLAADTLIVRFVPEPDSVYVDTEASTPLSISEQTQATVAIEAASNTTRFDAEVRTNGTVRTAGRPVGGLPIEASLGEWTLGQTTTDANGTFSMDGQLPASVPDGQQNLSARIAMSDRAVSTAVDTTPITVAATETTLDVGTTTQSAPEAATTTNESTEGTPTNRTTPADTATGSELAVTGTLQTASEVAVPAQPVTLQIGTETVTTVSTAADGTFRATLSASERAALDGGTPLTARFDGTGTNLAGTNTTVVPFPAADTDDPADGTAETPTAAESTDPTTPEAASGPLSRLAGLLPVDSPALLAIAALVAGAVGTTWFVRRRVPAWAVGVPPAWLSSLRSDDADGETQTDQSDDAAPDSNGDSAASAASATAMRGSAALAEAESLREEDPSAAIQLAYTTLRDALTDRVAPDVSATATHREFLASVRDQLPAAEAFATITDTFEQATFSASEVTVEDADVVLDHAESILSAPSLRPDGGSDADEQDRS
jgi:hypothetical protein